MTDSKLPSGIDRVVGQRIRWRRRELKLTQERLGELLELTFQQVQKYETGQNRISASRLHRAATVLGTSVDTFFPPVETARGVVDEGWETLRFLTATVDGRSVASGFPLIEDRDVRRAVARIVRALARTD